MKRNIVFYAQTAAGEYIKYDPRPLVKPERTKLWKRLNAARESGQLFLVGYGDKKAIDLYIK